MDPLERWLKEELARDARSADKLAEKPRVYRRFAANQAELHRKLMAKHWQRMPFKKCENCEDYQVYKNVHTGERWCYVCGLRDTDRITNLLNSLSSEQKRKLRDMLRNL